MTTYPLAVLNTAIVTTDGDYRIRTITLEEAQQLARAAEIDSAVGHESTAQILTNLLGVEVPVNRQLFEQAVGQPALVFKLNGRPPEGQILSAEELTEVGFTFKILERTS